MIGGKRDRRRKTHGGAAHIWQHLRWSLWLLVYRRLFFFLRRRIMRRLVLGGTIIFAFVCIIVLGLWWRLSSGPIEFDMATPWLKAAIEQNFGGRHGVTVGGAQIERDEDGGTSLRLRDIVVRDSEGTVVASAPKAEVGISGRALLSGQLRAESLNLVGAELSVRIETDGRVTVFAGADTRPIATAVPPSAIEQAANAKIAPSPLRDTFQEVAGALSWLDSMGATGLDGHDLHELGLKDGRLIVDDRRKGRRWTFDHINASLARPKLGGITFHLESGNPNRPWVLNAAMRPLPDGIRAIGIEARKVSVGDIMLAMRMNDGGLETDLPISVSVRADISPDGTLQIMHGQLLAESGTVTDRSDEPTQIKIDHADFRFDWDVRRRSLIVPFQIQAGGNQFTMRATFESSREAYGEWLMTITRGDSVIDPIILAPLGDADTGSFAFNRADVRARIDPVRSRIDVEQGDFRRIDTRPLYNTGVAVTGSLDWSGAEPNVAFGVAATRMPFSVMKQLWPTFVTTNVRSWVDQHISSGTIDRVLIAANSPLQNLRESGPPTSEESLSIDIEGSGITLQPLAQLPAIRDADLTVHITGTSAKINLGRGIVEVEPGRELSIVDGVFEIPNTHLKPAPAHATFGMDGTLAATTVLLSSEALHDSVGIALDSTSSHGAVSAQVTTNFKIGRNATKDAMVYAINAELTNFAADKILFNQRIEAAVLNVAASNKGYQIKGDIKINGMPAAIELHKRSTNADGELHVAASIDDAARRRLGLDLGRSVIGTIPIRATARFGGSHNDGRLAVDADLTAVKIDNLFPGWVKPTGRAARATYILTKTSRATRLEDLVIDGTGATVKGSIEIANSGDIVSANFPVFNLTNGDKTALRAERGEDGTLRVIVRGDAYDGRNFVKSTLAGMDKDKKKFQQSDLDLDIKIGAVAGYNGETLRNLDLQLSRRGGYIQKFSMNSKIGHDTPLSGDLRVRVRDNHQVVYFATDEAGALFRFTDMYPRMFGGRMWIAMDPPTPDQTPQAGTLYIRDFVVRGEPVLDSVVADAANQAGHHGVDFSEMRAEFTRFSGKMAVREGIVRGPLVGVTVEGQIDNVRNDAHLRGTFVPFYGLNNMFGQIPILNMFLAGGRDEGLFGITYEAVGPPSAPRISVNPVSAIAPGLLRKFVPSPGTFDPNFIPPSR